MNFTKCPKEAGLWIINRQIDFQGDTKPLQKKNIKLSRTKCAHCNHQAGPAVPGMQFRCSFYCDKMAGAASGGAPNIMPNRHTKSVHSFPSLCYI